MPDDSSTSEVSGNQISRMGERVASLEATIRSEFPALKADTERLRTMAHDLNGTLQQFVAMTLTGQTALKMHMEACDMRGRKLEKLGVGILTVAVTALGFLIKRELFH